MPKGPVVEEIGSLGGLDAHREEWAELAQVAPNGGLFETPHWITVWLASYWQDRSLAFLFVRKDDKLIGMAPLLEDGEGRLGCPGSLVTPVCPHTRRCGILFRQDPAEVLDAITRHLEGTRRAFRLRIPCTEASSPMVGRIGKRRRGAFLREVGRSPVIRIEGSWEEYLGTRTRHLRRELTRKRRKLETHWAVDWTTAEAPNEQERAVTDVLRIERNSWKDRQGTSICSEPGAMPFYSRIAREAGAAGWLRIEVLRLDSQPVAHLFGVVYRNVYYALKTSYDEAFSAWAPGTVLFQYVIERAFEQGLDTFDFLGSASRWKDELANESRQYVEACVFAPAALRCRWDSVRQMHIKPFVEHHAPALLELRRGLKTRGALRR